jgi:hypothetical protein
VPEGGEQWDVDLAPWYPETLACNAHASDVSLLALFRPVLVPNKRMLGLKTENPPSLSEEQPRLWI